jgi:predicted MFS family arabinose efflux permease
MENSERVFTPYQGFVIAILAILQFTVILDFMVLSPLGALLMDQLHVQTTQFGYAVSAYAFSAGISGLLTAGFADKFDRKKLLLFFYSGFLVGTLLCALAPDYHFLLLARIITGLFGGVVGSISMAIITDLFRLEVRGRVMGFIQMAFSASQVLGIPIGLFLANRYGWHSPFWMISGFGLLVGLIIVFYLKPIAEHLKLKSEHNAFVHLFRTVSQPHYLRAFLATILLATGGFMLMPFGSAFSIHNLGLTNEQLPILYGVTGVFSIAMGPLMGKLSDRTGKYVMFCIGTTTTAVMIAIYTHLSITPLWMVIGINVLLFAGILSRMISASSLMTAIPAPKDRGAFMSVNASIQQISGGFAAALAGVIVVQTPEGPLKNYDYLGYLVIACLILTVFMLYFINRYVQREAEKMKHHHKEHSLN